MSKLAKISIFPIWANFGKIPHTWPLLSMLTRTVAMATKIQNMELITHDPYIMHAYQGDSAFN